MAGIKSKPILKDFKPVMDIREEVYRVADRIRSRLKTGFKAGL